MSTEVASPAPSHSRKSYKTTQKRALSRRGVLWLGQTCNLRCYFCYFLNRIADSDHPEHPFMDLDKAKELCHTLRYYYGDTAIDIQGGEPTIHPEIHELISYCNEIGLYPTLITNGLALAKIETLQKFKDSGIRDFLVSLHGIGDVHDDVVCRKGAYTKIIQAIENMVELDIPFRYNCTMSKPVVPLLPQIAEKAIEYGANAVNFIAFNPFEDQETGIRTHENVPTYADTKASLHTAMEILEEAGIECNVRYLPLCMAEEKFRKNFYNFQQLPYDHHEWNYESWMWTGMQPQRMKPSELNRPYKLGRLARRMYRSDANKIIEIERDRPIKTKIFYGAQRVVAEAGKTLLGKDYWYRREAKLRAIQDLQYEQHEKCQQCNLRNICDGFHGDYAKFYGTDEATPVTDGTLIDDPLHYIKDQVKIVEDEDVSWAL